MSHILSYLCEVISKLVHKKGAGTMTDFFPKIANCDLDLGHKIQDCKLIQDNVAFNICVKLLQNL